MDKMENIKVNDFFDKVYLINLKRRPDKLKTSTDLLNKFVSSSAGVLISFNW